MRSLAIVCVVLVAGCARPPADAARGAVIFGADDRREVIDAEPALRDRALATTAMMVARGDVSAGADGSVRLNSRGSLGTWLGLCPDEAFVDQPSAGTCSGVLVDTDLVLTAGHCLDEIPCRDQSWVFGWHRAADGDTSVGAEQIRRCASVLVSSYTDAEDYAIVRLDAPRPGPPAEIGQGGASLGDRLDVSGHPYGLPMKTEAGALVTATPSAAQFWARIDAMPGSSGSPIWDREGRVLGVLHGGSGFFGDLVLDGACRRVRVVREDDPSTEIITRAEVALEALCAGPNARPALCCPGCDDAGAGEDAGLGSDAASALDASGPDAGVAPVAGSSAAGARGASWPALACILAALWLARRTSVSDQEPRRRRSGLAIVRA